MIPLLVLRSCYTTRSLCIGMPPMKPLLGFATVTCPRVGSKSLFLFFILSNKSHPKDCAGCSIIVEYSVCSVQPPAIACLGALYCSKKKRCRSRTAVICSSRVRDSNMSISTKNSSPSGIYTTRRHETRTNEVEQHTAVVNTIKFKIWYVRMMHREYNTCSSNNCSGSAPPPPIPGLCGMSEGSSNTSSSHRFICLEVLVLHPAIIVHPPSLSLGQQQPSSTAAATESFIQLVLHPLLPGTCVWDDTVRTYDAFRLQLFYTLICVCPVY